MKNYALLDENNIVINVSVADESWDATGWIEYTDANPARIGDSFVDGIFMPPKPEGEGWTWDETEMEWVHDSETEALA